GHRTVEKLPRIQDRERSVLLEKASYGRHVSRVTLDSRRIGRRFPALRRGRQAV
ncbi:unnamed protein product, partial [Musa textilis]